MGRYKDGLNPFKDVERSQLLPGRMHYKYYIAVKTRAGGQGSARPSPPLPDGWLFQHILRATSSHPRYTSLSRAGTPPTSLPLPHGSRDLGGLCFQHSCCVSFSLTRLLGAGTAPHGVPAVLGGTERLCCERNQPGLLDVSLQKFRSQIICHTTLRKGS